MDRVLLLGNYGQVGWDVDEICNGLKVCQLNWALPVNRLINEVYFEEVT